MNPSDPSAACHLPRACRPHRRGSADPFSLKTVHWTVFRALEPLKTLHRRVFRAFEPLKTLHRRVFRALDAPERITTVNLATALPKAFPSDRRERFRGRWISRKMLALFRERRMRSFSSDEVSQPALPQGERPLPTRPYGRPTFP